MENIYSAWGINQFGVLYYSGLTTNVDTLTFEDHNPIDRNYICEFTGVKERQRQYQVWAVNKYGFIHGIYPNEKHGLIPVLIHDCWLMGEKLDKPNLPDFLL